MQSDLFSCCICFTKFDCGDHLPKVMPTCGHTFCFTCLTQFFAYSKECPMDRIQFPDHLTEIKNFPTNHIVVQLITEKSQDNYSFCIEHRNPKCLVCVDDRLQICKECASKHKNHNIKSIDELMREGQIKKKKLERKLEAFDQKRQEVESFIEHSNKRRVTVFTREFEKVEDALKKLRKDADMKLESLYTEKSNELAAVLRKDDLLKEKYNRKLLDLDNLVTNPNRFMNTVSKLDKGIKDFETNTLIESVKTAEEQYAFAFKNYCVSLASVIEIAKIENMNFEIPSAPIQAIKREDPVAPMNTISTGPLTFPDFLNIKIHEKEGYFIVSPRSQSKKGLPKLSSLEIDAIKEMKTIHLQFNSDYLAHNECIQEHHFQALKQLYSHCSKLVQLCILSFGSFNPDLKNSKKANFDVKAIVRTLLPPEVFGISDIGLSLPYHAIDDVIMTFASHFIANAKNLSKVRLDISDNSISDASVSEFCKYLKPICNQMTSFVLLLGRTVISDESIITLARENLSLMTNLETFELDLSNTHIKDQGFDNFCLLSANMFKNLKRFTLNISETKKLRNCMATFGSKILPNMPFLGDLTIYREAAKSSSGVVELFNGLSVIVRNIKNLTLYSSGIRFFGEDENEEIERFINLIDVPNMPLLKVFDIRFGVDIDSDIEKKLHHIQNQLSERNQ